MLTRVSATQVQDFALCKRKWYINSILKERGPETESLKIGTAVHTELEHYLISGVVRESPWSAHVALAAPLLPAAPVRPSVHIERWIEMPTYLGGPKWVGKIDVLDASSDILSVLDHKTCKTFGYNLTAENIGKNIQMAAYGYYGLTAGAFFQKNHVTISLYHTYIKVAGKPQVSQISANVAAEEIKQVWNDEALCHVKGMEKIALLPVWQEVPPNTDACNAYGGCPHQAKCGFTNAIEQLKGSETMSDSLLERLKKTKGAEISPAVVNVVAEEAKEVITEIVSHGIIPPDAPSRTSTPIEVKDVTTPKKAKKSKSEDQESPADTKEVKGFSLYIDCYPVRGSATPPIPFELIVAPVAAAVAEECGVADVRFVKYEAKARLAVAIRAKLATFPAVILVSSMANFADTFLEVAVPNATVVVAALKGIV